MEGLFVLFFFIYKKQNLFAIEWDKIMVFGELGEAAVLKAQLWFQTNQNKNEVCYCNRQYYYKYLQWSWLSCISASHDILYIFLALNFFINPVNSWSQPSNI